MWLVFFPWATFGHHLVMMLRKRQRAVIQITFDMFCGDFA